MKNKPFHFVLALLTGLVPVVSAEEREVTPEQLEAIQSGGDVAQAARPAKLPDLTKGEDMPEGKFPPQLWYLGPTGITGFMAGDFPGDQFQVKGTLKGSPAEGKFLWGDVIIGMNGKKFSAGGHLGQWIGNAIIEAEKAENKGKISFLVWRDKNYSARSGKKDVTSVDIDKLFDKAQNDDSLYDWKPEEKRKQELKKTNFDEFPLDPVTLEIGLTLRVLPAYTDTAPYDCPKTQKILEDAWKVLEQRFVVDPKIQNSGRGGVIEALALIASGKPEHRKLVYDWVRSKNCPWQPPTEPIGAMFRPGYKGYKGYQSWHHGHGGLDCALYYEATGDDYVLPALRKYAIETAMGQSQAGSWGHTFAFPSFNGGQLHMMNPGYGALNAAGNRCFFLIALAKKLGIEHPEIDAAIKRAHRFFGSYVDQGAIPYGDHGAAGTDDSNGKNTGIAFAMKLLGDDYGAKYFALMSTHASFTARGGHGHDYHTSWSSWGASLCGPDVRAFAERNMRWRRTLCRMHDGSFVYISPTGRYGTLRDPTATEVFNQAVIYKQTLITGKDANEKLYPTEREMKQLLSIAAPQFNDDWLKGLAGKPWMERSTDEVFDLLDVFMPKARRGIAAELGKRFQAGESAIAPRLVALLTDKNARLRHGALCALNACGDDVTLSNLSKIIPLLEAPEDFIRITAVEVVSKATDNTEAQLALLKTTVADRTALAPNSVRNAVQASFIASKLAVSQSPFQGGFDEALVEQALTNLILEDTGGGPLVGSKVKVWDKDTVIRLAGPLTYIAEEEQVFDQMFGARNAAAQAMLGKLGYLEAAQSNGYRIRKKAEISRHIRAESGFKDPMIYPDVVARHPGVFTELTDEIKTILIDNPLETITITDDSTGWKTVSTPLVKVLKTIEENKKPAALPTIADDVRRMFQTKLNAAEGAGAKIKLCRDTLANPQRMDTFHKIAAMEQLVELSGPAAIEDLLPYLGHDYWRLRENSRRVATPLAQGMAGAEIAGLFASAADAQAKAGLLELLALAKPKAGLDIAKEALKHESTAVRASAVNALSSLGGDTVTEEILTLLKSAGTEEERLACEEALLARIGDPSAAGRIRDRLISMPSGASPDLLDSLYYLIARIGDAKSIDALRKAATTADATEFNRVMLALSYSPSREADKVLLEIATANPKRAQIIGPHAVRRMVIGPKGYGDISSTDRMDFAEAMLKVTLEPRIINLLGNIHEARALRALMFCLEKGAGAAESIVTNVEGMEKLGPDDTKIAVETLRQLIEFIEVTKLRGGMEKHMNKDDNYVGWKALQARAGKALLKFHNPGAAPIPGFDPLELDR